MQKLKIYKNKLNIYAGGSLEKKKPDLNINFTQQQEEKRRKRKD